MQVNFWAGFDAKIWCDIFEIKNIRCDVIAISVFNYLLKWYEFYCNNVFSQWITTYSAFLAWRLFFVIIVVEITNKKDCYL